MRYHIEQPRNPPLRSRPIDRYLFLDRLHTISAAWSWRWPSVAVLEQWLSCVVLSLETQSYASFSHGFRPAAGCCIHAPNSLGLSQHQSPAENKHGDDVSRRHSSLALCSHRQSPMMV